MTHIRAHLYFVLYSLIQSLSPSDPCFDKPHASSTHPLTSASLSTEQSATSSIQPSPKAPQAASKKKQRASHIRSTESMSTHQHYKQDPAKPLQSIRKPPIPKKPWTAAQAAEIAEATRINQEADRALQAIRERMLQQALANKNPEDYTLDLGENKAQL
ncbi:hypothetical protein FPQ18DRAFT_310717 [Pyronema domesticum]|nr:hypothetical protein FPQ18DRAFT_310717 [Pyronema domesticum]